MKKCSGCSDLARQVYIGRAESLKLTADGLPAVGGGKVVSFNGLIEPYGLGWPDFPNAIWGHPSVIKRQLRVTSWSCSGNKKERNAGEKTFGKCLNRGHIFAGDRSSESVTSGQPIMDLLITLKARALVGLLSRSVQISNVFAAILKLLASRLAYNTRATMQAWYAVVNLLPVVRFWKWLKSAEWWIYN